MKIAPKIQDLRMTKVTLFVVYKFFFLEIGEVAGRLAKVELENFMCHATLSVSLDVKNNNCFYIGGPNGSKNIFILCIIDFQVENLLYSLQ